MFIDEAACKIITDSLNFCIQQKCLGVNAYVIMPTHLHAIVFDVESNPERLKHTLDDTPPRWFGAGVCKFTGRQRPDYSAIHLPKPFAEDFKNKAGKDRERRFWQPTQHAVGIISNAFWKQKIVYVHENPCRKELVLHPEDW